MAFHSSGAAVTATCDMCGDDWWRGYEDVQPLFVTLVDARHRLPVDFMWTITEQPDGALQMLCASCTQIEECVRNGHAWVPLRYELDGELREYGQVCSCCSVVRSHDVPPADHPESMTAELSPDQEAWLAAVDAEIDPDRANEAA